MKSLWTCLAFAGLLAAGACSNMPTMSLPSFSMPSLPGFSTAPAAEAGAATAAAAQLTAREHVSKAADLLGAGKEAEAKAELQAALAQSPKDVTALHLLKQIETDPAMLLGDASQPYVVQAGDTMSGLADRFLGDGLMFYALSRYNSLSSPNALAVGRTLKIPLTAKAPITTATLTPLPEAAAPAATAKPVDAAKANAVRLQALQLLNTGDVPRAVALLREAVSLDETDPVIRKDLDRALRIQSALDAG